MFSHAGRPFYQSTQFLFLDHLKKEDYTPFINHHFAKSRKKIDLKSIEEIIEWTKLHTFYVQLFCHKVDTPAEEGTVLTTAAGATVEAGTRQDAAAAVASVVTAQGCTSPTFFGTNSAGPRPRRAPASCTTVRYT